MADLFGGRIVHIIFLLGFVIILADTKQLGYGLPPLLIALLALALLASVLTIGVVVCAGLAWKERWWSVFGRAHYTLVALATLAFVWELAYWNLLGIRF